MKKILAILMALLCLGCMAQTPEQRLQQLGIQLPEGATPLGNYTDVVQSGKLLFLAGKGPLQSNGQYIKGKLGASLSVGQGYEAARLVAIQQIAVLKRELGSLSRVKRIVKVNGFVNSDNNFSEQPKVINGFSDLMVDIFGESGKHARTALGVNVLPSDMAVEIEMIVEIE